MTTATHTLSHRRAKIFGRGYIKAGDLKIEEGVVRETSFFRTYNDDNIKAPTRPLYILHLLFLLRFPSSTQYSKKKIINKIEGG